MVALVSVLALVAGCGGGGAGKPSGEPKGGKAGAEAPKPDPKAAATELPTVRRVFDLSAGDPAVPADLGGPGFTGEGWTTRLDAYALGSKDAVRGGTLVTNLPDWPTTLRLAGENWNNSYNYSVVGLLYHPLLSQDPVTLDYAPDLATHWWISEDRSTYRFRIDPTAKWSDGKPITSEDVVASWKLRVDPGIRDPSSMMVYGKVEQPVAVSKYIVEVKAKQGSWTNFLYFATMPILPAHDIGALKGEEYLDKYQFAYPAVSGPYVVKPEDIVSGESITLTRRTDWWAEGHPENRGMYNFDHVRYVVVKDPQLTYEKLKKGELDFSWIQKAQWWAEEIPELEDVKRGLLVPRKFFTEAPVGYSGLALNMKRPPLDDLNVRRALQHLYDRETMISKLFYGEYLPLASYYPGGPYQNPDNRVVPYDEVAAVELLEKSGWTEKNAEGYRVKDGQELALTVTIRDAGSLRYLTLFQESCKSAGIRIEIDQVNDSAAMKNLQSKSYQVQESAWGALVFPNPETSFKSELADLEDNNNVTAFKDPRVDALCDAYDQEYDPARRIDLVRQIDGLVYEQSPYILGWYMPAQRVMYWNKFGMPEWGTSRVARATFAPLVWELWWVDPDKEAKVQAGKSDPSVRMAPPEERDVHFWPEWSAAHGLTAAGTGQLDASGSGKAGKSEGEGKAGKSEGEGKAGKSEGEGKAGKSGGEGKSGKGKSGE